MNPQESNLALLGRRGQIRLVNVHAYPPFSYYYFETIPRVDVVDMGLQELSIFFLHVSDFLRS